MLSIWWRQLVIYRYYVIETCGEPIENCLRTQFLMNFSCMTQVVANCFMEPLGNRAPTVSSRVKLFFSIFCGLCIVSMPKTLGLVGFRYILFQVCLLRFERYGYHLEWWIGQTWVTTENKRCCDMMSSYRTCLRRISSISSKHLVVCLSVCLFVCSRIAEPIAIQSLAIFGHYQSRSIDQWNEVFDEQKSCCVMALVTAFDWLHLTTGNTIGYQKSRTLYVINCNTSWPNPGKPDTIEYHWKQNATLKGHHRKCPTWRLAAMSSCCSDERWRKRFVSLTSRRRSMRMALRSTTVSASCSRTDRSSASSVSKSSYRSIVNVRRSCNVTWLTRSHLTTPAKKPSFFRAPHVQNPVKLSKTE